MASEGLDFHSARRQLANRMKNIAANLSYGNFPRLPTHQAQRPTQPPLSSYAATPDKSSSYSEATSLVPTKKPQARQTSEDAGTKADLLNLFSDLNQDDVKLLIKILTYLENSKNKSIAIEKMAQIFENSSIEVINM